MRVRRSAESAVVRRLAKRPPPPIPTDADAEERGEEKEELGDAALLLLLLLATTSTSTFSTPTSRPSKRESFSTARSSREDRADLEGEGRDFELLLDTSGWACVFVLVMLLIERRSLAVAERGGALPRVPVPVLVRERVDLNESSVPGVWRAEKMLPGRAFSSFGV